MAVILNILQLVWAGSLIIVRIVAFIFGITVAMTVVNKTAEALGSPAEKVGGGIFWILSAPFRGVAWIYRKVAGLFQKEAVPA